MSDEKTSSWRDNKTVLRLVRIGFLLQFYIPAVVCGYFIWVYFAMPVEIPPRDDPNFRGAEMDAFIRGMFFQFAAATLAVLAVEWTILTLALRRKTPSAGNVLGCLVYINILHSGLWLLILFPLTLIRLAPPTILYILAIRCERGRLGIPTTNYEL